MKSGFSSLELIMAMTISAIIMTSLLQIYNQVIRNTMRIERFVFEDTQVLTIKNRLDHDLAGLSAIWFTQEQVENQQAKVLKIDQKNSSQKQVRKEAKKSSTCFYSANKENNLATLTFVTNNPLQSYGSALDRFVRVVYRVENDPQREGMLRLMRKEIKMPTEIIEDEILQKGTFYELAFGIKSLEMTYQFIDKTELQKQAQAKKSSADEATKAAQQLKPVIRSVKEWGLTNKPQQQGKLAQVAKAPDESSDADDLGGAVAPSFVAMNIVFAATDQQVEKTYKLEFYIPSLLDHAPKGILAIKKPAPIAPSGGGSGAQG